MSMPTKKEMLSSVKNSLRIKGWFLIKQRSTYNGSAMYKIETESGREVSSNSTIDMLFQTYCY
jgi:hypothetical protein